MRDLADKADFLVKVRQVIGVRLRLTQFPDADFRPEL